MLRVWKKPALDLIQDSFIFTIQLFHGIHSAPRQACYMNDLIRIMYKINNLSQIIYQIWNLIDHGAVYTLQAKAIFVEMVGFKKT